MPTIATALKKHSKQRRAEKRVKLSRPLIPAAERSNGLPLCARCECRSRLGTRRWSADRMCISDSDGDDGDRLERHSVGRRSFSDDELSKHRSPPNDNRRRQWHNVQSPTAHCDDIVKPPRITHRRCCVCHPPATLRY